MVEENKQSAEMADGEEEMKEEREEKERSCEKEAPQEAKEASEGQEATAEEESFENKYIRLSADFQNYKKRTEKEKSDLFKSANTRLITELLPLIDDFDRAIAHSSESSRESFSDGMEMIIKRFLEILLKEGLEYIDTTDAVFDPNLHHAVLAEKVEGVESGTILMEMQKGYKVNGKVVRPSMVKVAE